MGEHDDPFSRSRTSISASYARSVEVTQSLRWFQRPRSEALDAIGLWAAVALTHGVANPLALLQGRGAHHD